MDYGKISKWAVMNIICLKLNDHKEMGGLLDCINELKTEVDYGDFADAVMETNMSSFYKNSILRAVPIRGTSALYSALISVVNSDMSSYYISETVKDIVKEFRKGV